MRASIKVKHEVIAACEQLLRLSSCVRFCQAGSKGLHTCAWPAKPANKKNARAASKKGFTGLAGYFLNQPG